MKTIKVFIAFSDELEIERQKFTDMSQQLNNILISMNFEIVPFYWNSSDGNMSNYHDQDEYNSDFKSCEMFLAFFGTKLGNSTKSILDTAYSEHCAGRNPKKLYVYFKDAEDITPELKAFKDSFDTSYGHFYCRFENVETMMFHFLLQLVEFQDDIFRFIDVDKSQIRVLGKPLFELQNIPFAGKNQKYLQLLEDKNIIQEKVVKYPDKENLYNRLKNLRNRLYYMEISLLDTAKLVSKLSSTVSSARFSEAMRLFEAGDNKGANAVLNLDEIIYDAKDNAASIDAAREIDSESIKALESNINEIKLKISTLQVSREKGWEKKVISAYKKAISIVRNRVSPKITAKLLLEYADFLYNNEQEVISQAIYEEASLLLKKLSEHNPVVYDVDLANTITSLAILYAKAQRLDLAEKRFHETLYIGRRLSAQNPEVYESFVADNLDNLAILHINTQHYDFAEKELNESLEIYRRLSTKHPEVHGNRFAAVLNRLAHLHLCNEQFDQVEKEYNELLEYYRRLSVQNPGDEDIETSIAGTLSNLGELYFNTQRFELSRQAFVEANEMYRPWAELYPFEYEPYADFTQEAIFRLLSDRSIYDY